MACVALKSVLEVPLSRERKVVFQETVLFLPCHSTSHGCFLAHPQRGVTSPTDQRQSWKDGSGYEEMLVAARRQKVGFRPHRRWHQQRFG
jgi:hypothetical protein